MHKEEISYLFLYLKALIVQTQGGEKNLLEQADPCDWEGTAHPGIDGLHSTVCHVFASGAWIRLGERTTGPCWAASSAVCLPFVRCTLWVAGSVVTFSSWDSLGSR